MPPVQIPQIRRLHRLKPLGQLGQSPPIFPHGQQHPVLDQQHVRRLTSHDPIDQVLDQDAPTALEEVPGVEPFVDDEQAVRHVVHDAERLELRDRLRHGPLRAVDQFVVGHRSDLGSEAGDDRVDRRLDLIQGAGSVDQATAVLAADKLAAIGRVIGYYVAFNRRQEGGAKMAEQESELGRESNFLGDFDQPLIGIMDDHQRHVRYFITEEDANATLPDVDLEEALALAGAWSDLDWEAMEDGLERLRHESKPTLPLSL